MGFGITLNLINALIIISTFSFGLSFAKNTITSAQFIRDSDSETVTSNSSDFRLGFFSPHNSTYRYVGIWYLSETNIVWVANRDQPLKDSSGVFRISQDGNLVVLNGQNLVLWSSNVSNNATTNITAQLQDSGNLVLLDNTTGETVWQSFEHPCDAAVPKMKISANRFTGKKIQFVSWKTPSDPSSGYFSGTLERLDVPEVFFLVNGTQPYWRTGPWNGRVFIGSPQMSTGYLYGWTLVNQADGTVYLTYNFIDPASSGILSLNPQGRLKLVRFYNKKQTLSWVIEQTACDHYGTCGEFGSCNQQDSPICSCLTGFEPRNSEEWKRENWTSGCVRKSALMCERSKNGSQVGEEDGFLKFQNMKVPDFAERSDADTEGQCGTECLGNCSCLAYAYDPGIGCMYWSRDLIDVQKFSNGGVDLYIRLVHSELGDHSGKSKDKKAIVAITVSIGTIILAASAYLVFCTHRSRRKWTSQHRGNQSQKVIEGNKQVKLDELPLYDFEVLAAATNNFHFANMLGKGGFGRVYKGTLPDDQEIAVKRLSRTSGQGLEEFMNEVLVISKLQHRNLVRLLGCCVEGDEKMLIYEFMPNKSLDAFLFDQHQRKLLDWTKRFNIIEGIARGLLYLHRDSRLRIIHRDLKASNILLDGEMNPKISDFGLARIFGASEDEVNTKRVVGTYGYMSPEYAMEGLFSEKSDVYSFGVLLLEIISGRRNSSFFKDEETLSLLGFAWKLWNEEKVASLVDAEIWDPSNERHILKCIHIGLLCVQEAAKERPSMTNVVMMLISENVYLPPPKQVAFVHKQSLSSSESSNSKEAQRNSLNNVTLTDIEGR